jgi:hypothetical protein
MRGVRWLLSAAVSVSVLWLVAGASAATGAGSPSCLRGSWVASSAETNRVLRALVPVPAFEAKGPLYMTFQRGLFQYGSRAIEITNTFGDTKAIARARFFTLARYTARTGQVTFGKGTSTIEYGKMTSIKGGVSYTVDGPPPKTTPVPGGTTPFVCAGSTLKVKLPRISRLAWITLRRGTP